MADLPLLSLLLLAPLAGIGLLWLMPVRLARTITLGTCAVTLLLAVAALAAFAPDGERFQLLERHAWLPGIGASYLLAVDGLSVLFLPSTALLFLGAVVVQWRSALAVPRAHDSLLLLFLCATLGIFCALDTLLFFLFWELTLIPLYFLLGHWGVIGSRVDAAGRYLLLMLAGGLPLLLGFLLLASDGAGLTFDFIELLGRHPSYERQRLFFLLCLLGFGLKVPLVPLHTWLPQFALAAPGALTALLLGLKVGAYGLLRFAIPLAPDAAQSLHWLLAGLGTVTLIYGAVAMLAQSNLRALFACASISHVGLVILGLAAFTAQGAHGAVALLLSFSVSSGGALLLVDCLRLRTGHSDLHLLGGVAGRMPLLASGLLICGLAGVGMPGTSSFPGEFMLILAILETHSGAGMAALFGLAIAAGAFLAAYRRAFFGPASQPAVRDAEDLIRRERWLLAAIIGIILGIGLYPAPWLELPRTAAEAWALALRH